MRTVTLLACATLAAAVPALAQTEPDLTKPAGKDWLTIGGDLHNSRYSTLAQITPGNVTQLKGAWVTHLSSGLGTKYGFEATPIVKNGVMYIATGNDDAFALDARSGALIWEHRSGLDQNISTVCCGWDNRGVAIGEGKVFVGQLDGYMVALDQETGEEKWRSLVGKWQEGYTITSAPLYYKGVVYTGIAGGDREARGKLTALDAATGKELWHWWTVPGPGEPGSETWPSPNDPDPKRAQAYLHGGAAIWQTPAIDPELGLIYFSTGNPGPTAIGVGANRPGDNLYASSIVALHLDGSYAWHFQAVHHDLWDFDLPSPVVLFEQTYNGALRKGIAEGGKTGWVYILDRTTGKPLIGIDEKPVEQELRNATSPTQPYPIGDAVMPQCPKPLPGWPTKCIFGALWDVPTLMSPGGNGGINWANMAFNPQTGWFYVSAADRPSSRIAPGSGVQIAPALGAKNAGTYTAIDSRTNKIVWQKPMPYSIGQGSGTLTTASGLLFHGEPDGRLEARDAKTGDLLWSWQTGAGADAPAVTYEIDGEQYIAIASGGVSQQTTSANGDMVWGFSLKGAPGDRLKPFKAPPPPPAEVGFAGPIVATTNIKLGDYAYTPQRVTVPAGSTITFTNAAATPHNAAGPENGGWDTGLLGKDQSAKITFNTPGTYHYACTPHPFMIGEIVVTAKQADAGPIGGPSVVVVQTDASPGTVHTMEHAGR